MPINIFFENLKISIVGFSGAFILWALRQSLRIKRIEHPEGKVDWYGDEPIILAFWHAQQLLISWIYLDFPLFSSKKHTPARSTPLARNLVFALISKSKDGRFIAKVMEVLGIGSVAGSSSRGGMEAIIQLVRVAKSGAHIAITPDGPKGPVRKVKIGALKVAQLSGSRIIPSCFCAKRYWTFNSWDQMILPKPFSKAIIMTGEAMIIPKEADETELNELAVKLELELNRLTEEARVLLAG